MLVSTALQASIAFVKELDVAFPFLGSARGQGCV